MSVMSCGGATCVCAAVVKAFLFRQKRTVRAAAVAKY